MHLTTNSNYRTSRSNLLNVDARNLFPALQCFITVQS